MTQHVDRNNVSFGNIVEAVRVSSQRNMPIVLVYSKDGTTQEDELHAAVAFVRERLYPDIRAEHLGRYHDHGPVYMITWPLPPKRWWQFWKWGR